MSKYIVVILLFILPLVIFPQAIPSSFETPKIILAEIGIWLLLISTLLGKNKLEPKKFNWPALLILLGIICLTIVQVILDPSRINIFGNIFRLQGIFLLWQLTIFSLLTSQISLEKISNKIYFLFSSLLLIGLFLMGKNEIGRAAGTLGEPNALASVAVFILPFVIFKLDSLLRLLGIGEIAIVLFMAGSRAGILALILQVIFILLVTKFRVSKGFTILITISLLLVSFLLPFKESESFPENRAEIWKVALAGGKEKPIFGSGFGNVEKTIHETSIKLESNVQYQTVDSSHNIFLDWWIQGGVVGLGLFISLIYFTFRNFILANKKLETTALIGLLVVLSFNPASIVSLVAFWWIIGQSYSLNLTAVKTR